jgi:hypothetical protein
VLIRGLADPALVGQATTNRAVTVTSGAGGHVVGAGAPAPLSLEIHHARPVRDRCRCGAAAVTVVVMGRWTSSVSRNTHYLYSLRGYTAPNGD